MQEAVPEGTGAMAAILGLEDDAARAACAEAAQGEVVQAVNFNAPGQVVIAGHKNAVARAIEACKVKGAKRAMPLPVSAPFRSECKKQCRRGLARWRPSSAWKTTLRALPAPRQRRARWCRPSISMRRDKS